MSEEVTEGRRKLHNEELPDLHYSHNNIGLSNKKNEMGGANGTHEEEEKFIENYG
jgi:hypothetical protein